jgi:hypothetical protein
MRFSFRDDRRFDCRAYRSSKDGQPTQRSLARSAVMHALRCYNVDASALHSFIQRRHMQLQSATQMLDFGIAPSHLSSNIARTSSQIGLPSTPSGSMS